jgi:hypothetical protein
MLNEALSFCFCWSEQRRERLILHVIGLTNVLEMEAVGCNN